MGPQLDPFPVRGAAWCVPRGRDLSAFGRLPCPHEVAGSKQVEPRAVPPPLTQGWAWGGPRKPEQGPQARDTAGEALRQRAPDSKMRVRLRGEGARRQEGDSARFGGQGPGPPRGPSGPSRPPRSREQAQEPKDGPALISGLPLHRSLGRRLPEAVPGRFSTFEVPGKPARSCSGVRRLLGQAAWCRCLPVSRDARTGTARHQRGGWHEG